MFTAEYIERACGTAHALGHLDPIKAVLYVPGAESPCNCVLAVATDKGVFIYEKLSD